MTAPFRVRQAGARLARIFRLSSAPVPTKICSSRSRNASPRHSRVTGGQSNPIRPSSSLRVIAWLARETGQGVVEPAKLVGPMLARFMATDRAFAKLRRTISTSETAA